MSPAKATRPGFRRSMSVTAAEAAKTSSNGIHLFHPIYHIYCTPVRSRIDVDRIWPIHLEDEDTEDLIDTFSEPPQFAERLSPVSVQFGDLFIKGYNWTELRIKVLRQSLDLFGFIGRFMESALHQGGSGARIPFASISLDPDTIHRIVELDYESGESTYQQLVAQFCEGTVAPAMTTPFHAMLPLLGDAEVRLIARISFLFYHHFVKKYQTFLKRHGEDGLVVLPFWIPESAFQKRVIRLISEEYARYCKEHRLGRAHLVFLFDSHQANYRENDVLMKTWNILGEAANGTGPANGNGRKRSAAGDLHPAVNDSSIVFRDRVFSDWVMYANPSVKKLLDRTIAKVDSDINAQGIHYGWAHFEDLDSLVYSSKSILNFRQKLVKLAELGYVPLSPDFYVRGKLRGQLGFTDIEPQTVEIPDNSAAGDWHPDSLTFSRWEGIRKHQAKGAVVVEHRKIRRNTPDGTVEEEAPQGWKLAWSKVRTVCARSVIGDLEKGEGGMAEVLAGFTGASSARRRSENIQNFLAHYTYVYWREHFIQHDMSEADINIHEMANEFLRAGTRSRLSETDAAIAGAAAQAIYFALDSSRTTGTRPEHMDQRGFYQNVVMLTLAMCNSVYVYHWLREARKARRMVDLIKTELVGFEGAYQRYNLAQYGVKRKNWHEALTSQIDESRDNVVKRAAIRVAACHLRPLGYSRDFSRGDELMTTNVGHFWSEELSSLNCKYDNPYFCGVRET